MEIDKETYGRIFGGVASDRKTREALMNWATERMLEDLRTNPRDRTSTHRASTGCSAIELGR